MRKFWIVLIVIAVVAALGLGILWRFVSRFDRGADFAGGVLHWQVNQALAEERDESIVSQVFSGRPMVMREVVFALDRAARDHRIQGLLLDIKSLPVDWAKVEELRDGVRRFADAGKPVVAYLEGSGTREYALALAADEIALAPEGNLMILGVSAELVFLKQTLEKLGIEADYVHVGRFKSAPEMYTRSAASPDHRAMIEAIVESRYRHLLDMIMTGRRVEAPVAQRWVNAGIYDAHSAVSEGLVDTVLCLQDAQEWRFDAQELIPMSRYVQSRPRGRVAGRVALIHTTGTIVPGESHSDRWRGRTAGSTTVVEQLQKARENERIDAVLLRVDSPGGSALASDLIWHEVERVRQVKPVVVSMSGYAASGGYYISCSADSVFAEPGTLTGSIGVFAGKMDLNGFYDKLGIRREFVIRGENALLFSDSGTFTDRQREQLQALLSDFYDRFVHKVASGRRLSDEEARAIAEGRVWTGDQALQQNLVDGLGGLVRSLQAVKGLLGLQAQDRVAVISYERHMTLLERLLIQSLHNAKTAADPLPISLAEGLFGDGNLAVASLLDGRPLALMPFRVEFR